MTTKVRKLGIYVPDSRVQDIEEWRDEINFSELFWRAFDMEVQQLTGKTMPKRRRAVTAVSVPAELKQRMDALDDHGINWSAIAASAFRRKVEQLERLAEAIH